MIVSSSFLLLLSFAVYGGLHSLLAVRRWKLYLQNRFPSGYRYYRLVYSFFAVISLFPIIWLLLTLPDHVLYRFPFPWIIISMIIQSVIGVVLLIEVRQTGILSITGIRELFIKEKPSDKLNTAGLYKYVRHPIYSLGLVFMWLFPVMTTNLFSLWLAISIYIFIGAALEERKLLVVFPDYKNYQERVPMFVPKIHPP